MAKMTSGVFTPLLAFNRPATVTLQSTKGLASWRLQKKNGQKIWENQTRWKKHTDCFHASMLICLYQAYHPNPYLVVYPWGHFFVLSFSCFFAHFFDHKQRFNWPVHNVWPTWVITIWYTMMHNYTQLSQFGTGVMPRPLTPLLLPREPPCRQASGRTQQSPCGCFRHPTASLPSRAVFVLKSPTKWCTGCGNQDLEAKACKSKTS